jgi:hypothetical protein
LYSFNAIFYALGFPQPWQKLPVLETPHAHAQSLPAGFALPQPWQKLPVLAAPQAQFQLSAAG